MELAYFVRHGTGMRHPRVVGHAWMSTTSTYDAKGNPLYTSATAFTAGTDTRHSSTAATPITRSDSTGLD